MHYFQYCLWFGLLLAGGIVTGQSTLPLDLSNAHRGCELPVAHATVIYHRPYAFRRKVKPKELSYTINYRGDSTTMFGYTCGSWPAEAQSALNYALSIWSDVLQNDQSIDIDACFASDMPGGTLGSASANLRILFGYQNDTVVVPQALAEHLINTELSDSNFPDINVIINGNFDFYYGTDANPPGNQVDFVTLGVHELGHGLGFAGSARVDDGDATNGVECGVDSTGCIGYYALYDTVYRHHYSAYDKFVDLGTDASPITEVPNVSRALYDALHGKTGGLFFDDANHQDFYEGNDSYQLYTPGKWRQGSSFSHFADPSEVLYFSLSRGNAVHDVGRASEVMQNMGWSKAVAPARTLPVDLLSLTAHADGATVTLQWETARETENDYFEVQASRNGKTFVPIGRVGGAGTVTSKQHYRYRDEHAAPGMNFYRLRQVDYDETTSYSYVVGIDVDSRSDIEFRVYPNPVSGHAVSVAYFSPRAGEVRSQWYDRMGRMVHEEYHTVAKGFVNLPISVVGLPEGVYVLRLEGASGSKISRVVVTR